MLHTKPPYPLPLPCGHRSEKACFWPRLLRPLVPVFLAVTLASGARTPAADPPPDSSDDFPSVLAQDMERVFFLPGKVDIAEEQSTHRQASIGAAPNALEKKKINDDYDRLDKLIAVKKEEMKKSSNLIGNLRDQLAKADNAARVAMVNLIGAELAKVRSGASDPTLRNPNVEKVIELLQDPKPGQDGLTPAKYLAQLQPIVRPLIEFTKPDSDHPLDLRVAAALALGKVNGDAREVSPALAALLRDPKNPVALRLAAAEALGRPVNRLLETAVPTEKERTERQLELILIDGGHHVWPALMDGLHDPSARVRLACATAAKDVSGAFFDQARLAVVPGFFANYKDLLKAFRDKRRELATAVDDRDAAIAQMVLSVIEDLAVARLKIADSLAKLPPPPPALPPEGDYLRQVLEETRPFLVNALHSPNVKTRRQAGYALEDFGSDVIGVLADLTAALSDPDRFIRWTMLRTLGRLAPERPEVIVRAVIPLLCDSDIDVRLAALKTLERYGKDAAGLGAGRAIAKLVSRDDPLNVLAALTALQAIGDWDGPTLSAIAELLQNPEATLRVGAAETLGRAGAKAAAFLPALESALGDADEKVRLAASEALLRIKK